MENFEVGQEVYYSEITGDFYGSWEEVVTHHKSVGFTEQEIDELNEDLEIYFTTYA